MGGGVIRVFLSFPEGFKRALNSIRVIFLGPGLIIPETQL